MPAHSPTLTRTGVLLFALRTNSTQFEQNGRPAAPTPLRPAAWPAPDVTKLLTALSPADLAKQITLRDHALFRGITPPQLITLVSRAPPTPRGLSRVAHMAWCGATGAQGWATGSKDQKWARSPNVCASTERFNQLSEWVITAIVFEPDGDARRQLLTYFINVARALRELNNVNGTFAGPPAFVQGAWHWAPELTGACVHLFRFPCVFIF